MNRVHFNGVVDPEYFDEVALWGHGRTALNYFSNFRISESNVWSGATLMLATGTSITAFSITAGLYNGRSN